MKAHIQKAAAPSEKAREAGHVWTKYAYTCNRAWWGNVLWNCRISTLHNTSAVTHRWRYSHLFP